MEIARVLGSGAGAMTRGLLNKNPGNIRRTNIKWQGMADVQPDPDFITFKSDEYGIRTICRILLTYNQRGLNTCRQIISTWAPSSENDTAAYVADVANRCEIGPDDEIDVDNPDTMRAMVKAIVWHENGSMPYSDAVIDNGMRLAGIADMKPPSVTKSPVMQGAAAGVVGTGVAAASQVASQVRDVQDSINVGVGFVKALIQWGPWVAIALVAAGLVGISVGYYRKRQRLGV